MSDERCHGCSALLGQPHTFLCTAKEPPTANDRQEGGAHYRQHKVQVWDAIIDWDCGYLAGNVIKYVVRFRDKNGIEDLKKARHYLDKLIETEGAK